jgi:hypothetical protein
VLLSEGERNRGCKQGEKTLALFVKRAKKNLTSLQKWRKKIPPSLQNGRKKFAFFEK